MILNSPMILKSDNFLECLGSDIVDVKIYTDHKPKIDLKLYTTSTHKATYKERATGNIDVEIEDEKLNAIAHEIANIIKENK